MRLKGSAHPLNQIAINTSVRGRSMLIRFVKGSRWYTFVFIIIFAAVTGVTTTSAFAQTEKISENSKSLREGINRMWEILFLGASGTGKGSIFEVVNTYMLFFAFVILAFRAILLYREATNEGSEEFIQSLVVDKLIPVGIVLILLGSNGLYGGYLVLSARNAVYNLNKETGIRTEQIAKTNEMAGNYQGESDALNRLRQKQSDCASLAPEKDGEVNPAVDQCIQELKRQVENEVATGTIRSRSVIRKLEEAQKADKNPLTVIGSVIGGALQGAKNKFLDEIIKGWLLSFGILYMVIVEATMLIMGLIAPMAIATSLLNLKPLMEWITKFAGVGIMQLTYTVAVAAFQIVNSIAGKDAGEGFFTLALGIGAPLLSILVAMQTGGIVGAAVESSVLRAAGSASRFAGGKLGSAAGASARGAKWAGGKAVGLVRGRTSVDASPGGIKPVPAAISNKAKVRQ
jgi:hypothetical protein